ncbi:tyrosine-protein phosphatase [Xylanimonas protaetiae]|uniref:Tyrosine-protein phosphatase n=1 Tax=Xylanimonas protaetiae TaxID=2509457 RepID=A0A4P6FD34_9MICO|nr:tyrosine-protein phosphatase [Xylanimonas protaetiae]QAY71487.1 tyrosine-protein phosphatase [Xylanimonas protaetiae]
MRTSLHGRRPAAVLACGVALTAAMSLTAPAAVAGPAHPAAHAASGATHAASGAAHAASAHAQKPAAAGLTAVAVEAAGDGTWTVSWTGAGLRSVQVYVGADARHLGKKPAAVGRGASGAVTVSTTAQRPWVEVVPDTGKAVLTASRVLGLATATNARDIGGYRTQDGRWVKTGVVYRTNQLTLSAADAAFVGTLGITADYDLRTTGEVAAAPDVVPAGARYRQLDVIGGDVSGGIGAITTPEAAAEAMRQGEVAFVDSGSAKAAYRELFTSLARDKGASLYHCTAGKDRTGWATAVLLTVLGVDEQTVMDDYLLSNTYFLNTPAVQAQLDAMGPYREVYAPFMAVDSSYLQAGLDRVAQEYGSMEAYLTKGLGLSHGTIQQLRQRLLSPAPVPAS